MPQTQRDTSDLGEHASSRRATHRPIGAAGAQICETCGTATPWPCPTATWQEQWLATLNLEPEQLP